MHRPTRRRVLESICATGVAGSITGGVGASRGGQADPVRWRYEFESRPHSGPTVVDGSIFVTVDGDSNSFLVSLDAATGDVRWRRETDTGSDAAPLVVDGVLFHHNKARDADTGDVLWENSAIWDSGRAYADGRLYAGEFALDAATGERLWSYEADVGPKQPVVANGQVFGIDSDDGRVYASDAATGETNWTVRTEHYIDKFPIVTNGTLVVHSRGDIGDPDAHVIALDQNTGDRLWTTTLDHLRANPKTSDGERLYLRSTEDTYALDPETGDVVWVYPDVTDSFRHSPRDSGLTVADGVVYTNAGDHDGEYLIGIDAESGELDFEYVAESGSSRPLAGPPIVVDGVLYGSLAGLLIALDVEGNGSSEGSRVDLAVGNHHGGWRHGDARIGVDAEPSTDVSIRNLRFVQTVENTRALDPDSERRDRGFDAPASRALTAGEDHPDVVWTAPDPDLAHGRTTAPVFDARVADPDQVGELTLTTRLVDDEDESVIERSATLDGAAVRGEPTEARRERLRSSGVDVPEQVPLLEVLTYRPDLVEGDYPTLPALKGLDVAVELDGPSLDEPVSERLEVESESVRPMPRLSVGFVGVETVALSGGGTYTFDDDSPAITEFAKGAARKLNDMFPTRGVDAAVLTGSIDGPTAHSPRETRVVAKQAHEAVTGSMGDAHTFRVTPDGEIDPEVDVRGVHVTVAVVPRGEFFDQWYEGDYEGALPTDPFTEDPVTSAVIVEIGQQELVGHELVHYFGGDLFPDELAQSGLLFDDNMHATGAIESVGFDIQDGAFDVKPGQKSLVSYSTPWWPDATTYQALLESRFAGRPTAAERLVGWSRGVRRSLGEVRSRVERAPDAALDAVPDVDDLTGRLSDLENGIDAGLEGARGAWDAAAPLDAVDLEEARELADAAESLGDALADSGGEVVDRADEAVDGAVETAEGVGSELEEEAGELRDRLERFDGEVEYVAELGGGLNEAGDGVDLEYDVVPTVDVPSPLEGAASVDVRDAGGDVLESASAATEFDLLGQGGRETVQGAIVGAVPLPEEAAAVEVAVEDGEGGAVGSATVHPATDAIRDLVEALPDRALEESGVRESAHADLDEVETLLEDGDRDAAATTLEGLYGDLDGGIRADYEPDEAGQPSRDEVLGAVGVQVQRFGGDLPDPVRRQGGDGDLPATWLAGAGGLAATGAVAWYLRGDGEGAPEA